MHSNDPNGDHYRELCLAVGHLFIAFGRLEGVLGSLLKLHLADRIGGIDNSEAIGLSTALYGSMRFSTARDTIKRLAKAEKVDEKIVAGATSLFSHVGHIQNLRDMLAHQQILPYRDQIDGTWQITDAMTTRDIRSPKFYKFEQESIVLAANDLILAGQVIGSHPEPGHVLKAYSSYDKPVTWLYKPSMLELLPRSKQHFRL